MSVDFAIRFSDFSGGDFGLRDPALANANQISGENVTVYPSGLLGPRAGIKALPVTGLPAHPAAPGPLGFTSWGNKLLIVLNRVYEFPAAGGAATAWAAYPSPAVKEVRFVVGSDGTGKSWMYTLL